MRQIERKNGETIIHLKEKVIKFKQKPIFYGKKGLNESIAAFLSAPRKVVLAMNGYSSLTDEQCIAYGVQPGAYETACAAVLTRIIKYLQENFPGIQIRLAHGASDMGVDKAVINVGKKFNIPQLGFSCLEYIPYVKDDDVPVYVAPDTRSYCDAFTSALDILVTANGRKTTFEMDIDAVFKKHKDVVPVNIMRSISMTGGPPAVNAQGDIEDAVAFWYLKMHHVAVSMNVSGVDSWDKLLQSVSETSKTIVRRMMPANIAFGYEWH